MGVAQVIKLNTYDQTFIDTKFFSSPLREQGMPLNHGWFGNE